MFGAGFRVHGSCGPWPRTPDRDPRTEPRTKHPEPRTPPHRNEERASAVAQPRSHKNLHAGRSCGAVMARSSDRVRNSPHLLGSSPPLLGMSAVGLAFELGAKSA